jgi:hypothetical protein
VPRVALPAQPGAAGGPSAKAIPTAIAITIEIRVTRLWTLWQGKKSGSDNGTALLRIALRMRRGHPVGTGCDTQTRSELSTSAIIDDERGGWSGGGLPTALLSAICAGPAQAELVHQILETRQKAQSN